MSFQEIERHEVIGWDMDQTLISNPNSEKMHRFIHATPHKRHYIVTFRTHGWQHDVWAELAAYPNCLTQDNFVGVLNIEDERYERFVQAGRRKQPRLILPTDQDNGEELHPDELYYLEWKGRICHEHGITVLVDDMVHMVEDGCEKYGVTLINPYHL